MRGLMRMICMLMIGVYRYILSPLKVYIIGGNNCCRYEPSCSLYAKEAFRELPLGKAFVLTLMRILRCGPWGSGGYDPLPGRK